METGGAILSAMAHAIFLGTAAALLLAFIAASLLLTLEELWLRRWLHRRVVADWLRGPSVRAAFARLDELGAAISALGPEPSAPVPPVDPLRSLDGVVNASASLPTRQMLGVLSASVQADLAVSRPTGLAPWLAALGSLPIEPSPFAGLKQHRLPGTSEEERARGVDALRQLMQQHANRALDTLQARIARTTAKVRYVVAVALVAFISAFFTGGLRIPAPWQMSPTAQFGEWVRQVVAAAGPHLAVWLVAAAFVPILLAPLERLVQRGR